MTRPSRFRSRGCRRSSSRSALMKTRNTRWHQFSCSRGRSPLSYSRSRRSRGRPHRRHFRADFVHSSSPHRSRTACATRRRGSHRGDSAHRTPPCGSRPRWTMPGGRGGGAHRCPALSGGLGPLRGCRGRGAGLEAASRRARGGGKFRCAPLAVSCSSPAQRADTIQTVLQHSSSPGVEIESKMTGALSGGQRRQALEAHALGRRLEPEFGFWGQPTLFCSESARAGCRTGANASRSLSVLLFRTEPFVGPRCICVGIGCTAPFWSVAAARALGIPRGWRPVGHKQASSHERQIAAAAGEQAEAPSVRARRAGQGAELGRGRRRKSSAARRGRRSSRSTTRSCSPMRRRARRRRASRPRPPPPPPAWSPGTPRAASPPPPPFVHQGVVEWSPPRPEDADERPVSGAAPALPRPALGARPPSELQAVRAQQPPRSPLEKLESLAADDSDDSDDESASMPATATTRRARRRRRRGRTSATTPGPRRRRRWRPSVCWLSTPRGSRTGPAPRGRPRGRGDPAADRGRGPGDRRAPGRLRSCGRRSSAPSARPEPTTRLRNCETKSRLRASARLPPGGLG